MNTQNVFKFLNGKNEHMEQKATISALFGMTQRETAALLGIGYSQWSMHEAGKRPLPLPAQLRLADLLTQLRTAQKAKPATDKENQTALGEHIRALLHENEYRRALTTRKIAAAQRKLEKESRLMAFSAVLANREQGKSALPNPLTGKAVSSLRG